MIGTSHFHPGEIEHYLKQLEEKHGTLPPEQREELMISALQSKAKPSRAQYRMMATRNMTGGKKMAIQKPTEAKAVEMTNIISKNGEDVKEAQVVNFKASAYSVLENAGKIVTMVTRSSGDGKLQVDYSTEGVTANAGEDYIETSGILVFEPGETEKAIEVEIIDDDEPEEDEMFLVKLANPRPNAKLGSEGMTIVTIIDDDDPGLLGFKDEDTHCTAQESDGTAHIFVSRFKGRSGTVTVDYTTENISAVGGDTDTCDYKKTEGTLTFNAEEMRHEIIIPLYDHKKYDKSETFKVVLSNVKGPNEKAGLSEYHNCIVTIVHNSDTREVIDKVTQVLNLNADKYSVGTSSWAEQFHNAFTVGDDTGVDGLVDAEPPSTADYVLHYASLPWKLFFALVPPTDYGGGWVCFFVALAFIGFVTAMIADLANLFGCVIGLENEITAITLVALGTSLPDTFASKTAAVNDDNADACIGNVTGSNSVNVFLGLGLPWSMAAIYWKINGRNEEWVKRYGADDDKYTGDDDLNTLEVYKDYNSFPGFVVPAGSLGFSVIIFTICALVALLTLAIRRQLYGFELGGPAVPAYLTSAFFILLWFIYVGLSILQIKGVINSGPL
jgi:solute carrier family 8 (sodium/calcium exchanger)